MADHEKLVELLAQCCETRAKGCVGCERNLPQAVECKMSRFGKVADHLIANGVTVREWIPAAERMPEGLGIFEVMDATIGVIGFARYDPGKKLFVMLPSQYSNLIHVSHWRHVKVKGYYHKARMRGRWIWKDGKCFCSVCLKQGEPKYHYESGEVEEYDFCPNCGAMMDEEESDV